MITEAFGTTNNYLRLSQIESEEDGRKHSEKNENESENDKINRQHSDDDEEHKSNYKGDQPPKVLIFIDELFYI